MCSVGVSMATGCWTALSWEAAQSKSMNYFPNNISLIKSSGEKKQRSLPQLRCWWQALGCIGGCRSPA